MAVPIRTIQTDFSAGEIDPLASLNLNTGLRTIGLETSVNTIHQTSGAVSKRAPSNLIGDNVPEDICGKVELSLKDVFVIILFTAGKDTPNKILTASEKGSYQDFSEWDSNIDHSESKFSVYENMICEVNPLARPYLHTITFDGQGNPSVETIQMTEEQWGEERPNPTSCCFSQGRLLLAYGSTVRASRTPENGVNRFFDFSLADYTYTYVAEIDHGQRSSDPNLRAKAAFHFSTDEKLPEGEYTHSQYLAMKGLEKCVVTITDLSEFSEASNQLNALGQVEKQTGRKRVYTITTNYTGGIADYTDIVVKKHIHKIGSTTVDIVLTEGTTSYPDWNLANDTESKSSLPVPSIAPMVYSSHAVELVESDLYSSDIQWIATLGRVVVATKTAIFIATSDVISPTDFDLTITSYIGSSSKPPKLLNSWLIWASDDSRKMYAALYSNEIQGLSIVEITSNAHHLFTKGIVDYEMSDVPNQAVYVLTADGSIRVCAFIPRSDGYMFAWSTWNMPDKVSYLAIMRTKTGAGTFDHSSHPLLACVSGKDIKPALVAFSTREIYQYGEQGIELYADAIIKQNKLTSDIANGEKYRHKLDYDIHRAAKRLVCAISWNGGASTIIYAEPDGDGYVSLFSMDDDRRVFDIAIGIPYKTEIGLFTQILPNNSGTALMSKHSISRIDLQLYKSNGGYVSTGKGNTQHLLQMIYGQSKYSDSILDETGQPVSYTGVYGIDNPYTTDTDANIKIISDEAAPFNIMAVAQTIRLTEVY